MDPGSWEACKGKKFGDFAAYLEAISYAESANAQAPVFQEAPRDAKSVENIAKERHLRILERT